MSYYDSACRIDYDRWRINADRAYARYPTSERLDRMAGSLRSLLRMLVQHRTHQHERLGSWAVDHILAMSDWLRRLEQERARPVAAAAQEVGDERAR